MNTRRFVSPEKNILMEKIKKNYRQELAILKERKILLERWLK